MDELLGTIVSAIEDKKGKNILSLDLRGFDGAVADAFVVCSAESTTQVAAIAAGIEEKVFETLGQRPRRTEGMQNAIWVVVDYVDIMVHVFQTQAREFYRLAELWADAPSVRYGEWE